MSGRPTRIALVGSGFIAGVHAQVLRAVPDVELVAVCDPQRERAERLAQQYHIAHAVASIDELQALGGIDAVHVLVPPALHVEVASRCLRAGWHVLVEKPLALRAADADELGALARAQGRVLAVNHNQTFHPCVRRLANHLAAGRLGRLEHVALQHHVPLRQLQTGDVGHFMFQSEANILFEQGVHLFSLVFALLGAATDVRAVVPVRRELPNGVRFAAEWLVHVQCERGTASVRMAFGTAWTEATVQAIGTDGAALLDLQRGSCWLRRKTRWLDFLDVAKNLAGGALHLAARAARSVASYPLGLFRLVFPDDAFLQSMRGSLRAFHAAVRGGELPDAQTTAAAHAVLAMCERAAESAGASTASPAPPAPLPAPGPARAGEIVVLGGTGLLGRRCVQRLRAAGVPVTLVVRRPALLPEALRDGSVRVFAGDAADPGVLAAACAGASAVLHLATVAGDDPHAVAPAMAAAVRAAGEAALAAKVRRFVYASSTAALWLGATGAVTGGALPDSRSRARAPYSRAKIAAEHELAALRARGLVTTIVRPAIVVGCDGIAAHSGVGLWVRDNHCVGWGMGRHGLPFVLADDCAQALIAALTAPAAADRSYNLAGDVRLSAREYVEAMATRTHRDYRYHPTPLWWLWLQEAGKYTIKLLARRPRAWITRRDLASRSFAATLDCSDAVRDLGFAPESDRARFLARVFDEMPR